MEDDKKMQHQRAQFQTDAQLFALKVHAAWMKVEETLTFPFTWVLNQFNGTATWQATERTLDRATDRPSLRVVK